MTMVCSEPVYGGFIAHTYTVDDGSCLAHGGCICTPVEVAQITPYSLNNLLVVGVC